jgi:hypothetical protein
MFNYNPTVNDRSGEITAGYQTKSAEIKAAGNEALASGIMQGATSAIGGGLGAATGFNTAGMIKDASGNSIPGLGDALNSVKANAVKYETASGMMDTYKQNSEALGLDMQMLQGIEQKYANKPNELIGALTVVGKIGENNMDIQKAQKTYEALGNAYAGKAAATAAAKAALPDKMNAETMLLAVGRRPVTDSLGLENTKIETDRGYIKVDEFMRTAEPNVYAIGDVIPTPWLAHVASKEGCLAAEHIAGRHPRPINYNLVPNCTYCEPEIGSVGLTEAKAREKGYEVKVGKFPFSALGKAIILGETEGFVKVVSDAKYDEILGVHIMGPHATDLLAEACVALGLEATTEELGHIMHAHPTLSEAVMEAAEAVHGMATSI